MEIPARSTILVLLLTVPVIGLADSIQYEADVSGTAGTACGVEASYIAGGPFQRIADGDISPASSCPDGRFGMAAASSTGTTRGTLYAIAQATGHQGTGSEATFADATADASFSNFIDFMPSADNPSGTVVIGMRVDGALSGSANAGGCIYVMEFNILQCDGVSTVTGDQGQVSFVVSAGLSLNGPHEPILITESLMVQAGSSVEDPSSSAEFGRTAQAFLELPPGWTFTSASGDFLSATPAPEPRTFLPFALVVVLACVRKSRRGQG